MAAAFVVFSMATSGLLMFGESANAAIVPTVDMGTADDFSVLAGSTVTNTGTSAFANSVGVWPGTVITGVTPAMIGPSGTIEAGTSVAQAAQADLTTAYVDAAGRPVDVTTSTGQLGGLVLIGGVYAAPSKAALGLTGILTLDGGGNSNSVFIFQTDFAFDTAASSNILLVNGALECNVFWQVGGAATLGASSTFVGSILAQTAITVGAGVEFHGHALARDAAVTLDTDTFTEPTCAAVDPTTTTVPVTTSTTVPVTTSTTVPVTTSTTEPGTTTTTQLSTTSTEPVATSTTEPVTTSTTEPGTTPTTQLSTTSTEPVTATSLDLVVPTTRPDVAAVTLAAESTFGAFHAVAPSELPLSGLRLRATLLLAASIFVLGWVTLFVSRGGNDEKVTESKHSG
jgi:type VI secretion system secreted protein VgrG